MTPLIASATYVASAIINHFCHFHCCCHQHLTLLEVATTLAPGATTDTIVTTTIATTIKCVFLSVLKLKCNCYYLTCFLFQNIGNKRKTIANERRKQIRKLAKIRTWPNFVHFVLPRLYLALVLK